MEMAKWMREKPTVHKRIFIAFSDLAVLVALKDQAMTGYGINNYFMRKVGHTTSPSTVYSTLSAIEREGLIKCVRNKSGRAYSLTDKGGKIVDNMDNIVRESKRFMDKLLT